MPDASTPREPRGRWRDEIRRRLAGLRLAPEREQEVIEEISQHLDDRYRELCLGGADDSRAIREALDELDEADLVRELAGVEREVRSEPLSIGSGDTSPRRTGALSGFWHDVRFGARLLGKDPSVALVIIFTLALAIAANTIVFGLTDLLLLRPVPVANALRLAAIFAADERSTTSRDPLSIPQYRDVARDSTAFEAVAAMAPRQLSLTGTGDPRAVGALLVTANFFTTLGLDALSGRTFRPGEDSPGRSTVAVLSHRFWADYFRADPEIIGRTLMLNGVPHAVVGVLTPSIEVGSLSQVDVWLPLETSVATMRQRDRDLAVFGLLKQGKDVKSANADLAV